MVTRKTKPPATFLAELGRIAILWNEIESIIKGLLILFVRDPIAPMTMAAGMNIATLISVMRTLSYERDAQEQRTYSSLRTADVRRRKGEAITPHVDHALTYVDRLREYRNYYIHCVQWGGNTRKFSAHAIGGKGRLTSHHAEINLADLKAITRHLVICERYFTRIVAAVAAQESYLHFHAGRRPAWPKKPPLPDKHQRENQVFLDVIPPPSLPLD